MQENPKPVRRIARSHSSLRGIVHSKKNDISSAFESSLERDYFKMLEFDSLVHEYGGNLLHV